MKAIYVFIPVLKRTFLPWSSSYKNSLKINNLGRFLASRTMPPVCAKARLPDYHLAFKSARKYVSISKIKEFSKNFYKNYLRTLLCTSKNRGDK